MKYAFHIVGVFTSTPFGSNHLAILPDAAGISTEPTAFFKFDHFVKAVAELRGYAVAHPNVTVTTAAALEGLKFPEKLDLFWISRNYHDLHDDFLELCFRYESTRQIVSNGWMLPFAAV